MFTALITILENTTLQVKPYEVEMCTLPNDPLFVSISWFEKLEFVPH